VNALAVADANLPNCANAEHYPAATAMVGNTLVARGFDFAPKEEGSPARYLYQWQKHNGRYFENVPGANYKRLEPQEFSGGDVVRVVVTPYEHIDEPQYQDLLLGASQVVGQTIGVGPSFASHTGGEEWCMVSIPTQDDSAVLGDFTSSFYLWDESAQSYEEAVSVERGKGYWSYVFAGEGEMHSDGASVPPGDFITPPLTCCAEPKPGRHLVGNPFNKPIYWENTLVSTDPGPVPDPSSFTRVGDLGDDPPIDNMYYAEYDNVEGQYHYYDIDDFEQRDGKIFPWEGFWVIVKQGAYLKIPEDQPVPETVRDYGNYPLPIYSKSGQHAEDSREVEDLQASTESTGVSAFSGRRNTSPGKLKQKKPGESWRVKIAAFSGQLRDDYNYIGINPDGVNDYDPRDILDAGTMSVAHVMLYMQHDDWGNDSGNYCVDIHSNTGRSHQWKMTARATGLDSSVTIFWKKLSPGWKFRLIDAETGERVNMNETSSYTYSPDRDEERQFVIRARKVKE